MDFETYSEAGYEFVPNSPHGDVLINGRKRWVPPYSVKSLGTRGGLPAVGVPVYAEHPTTEILSLYYDLKNGKGRCCWLPSTPDPTDLLEHVAIGGLIEAHNATFEWWIWNIVGVRKYGWPPLPLSQIRCSMAKAKRYSLPGALDEIAKVLGTPRKEPDGKRLLQKLSRPHSPTKTRGVHRWTPATAWDDFNKLYAYNDKDVIAEDYASARIPDLTPYEFDVWQADQTINARGIQVDLSTLTAAIDIHQQAAVKYNNELKSITNGAVETVNQNKRFIEWIQAQGVHTTSLDAQHRTDLLNAGGMTPDARRALEIADTIMSANIKKLYTLQRQLSSDGRLRDQYQYCGADRTGRWSAGGVQLQNITAKGPKSAQCEDIACQRYFSAELTHCPHCSSSLYHICPEWDVKAVESAVFDIQTKSLKHVEHVWGAPVDVLCGCLRGMFIAKEDHRFICCDFSAIEAVVAACLARCQWRIDVFAMSGECIYTQSASKITGKPLAEYKRYRTEHNAHHPDRKKIGKIAELASGYGGWIGAWKQFGADEHFTDAQIKENVLKWRDESPEIVEMWGGQYRGYKDYELHGLEGCAVQALLTPGQEFSYNDIGYTVANDILYCRLPSGRYLYYHRPRLQPAYDKLSRAIQKITFESWNSNPQKGPIGWHRWETYGGRLFENVVQAVARDKQAAAILRCEAAGYPIVLHSHDEVCAEVLNGRGSVEEMISLLTTSEPWTPGWPINAAGWEHKRYQKD